MSAAGTDGDGRRGLGAGAGRLFLALVMVLALGVTGQARAATVVDLGGIVPAGLNAKDQVVGDLDNASNTSVTHAALWSSGSLTPLPEQAGASNSDAYAINATGRIVGDSTVPSPPSPYGSNDVHAVYWDGAGAPSQIDPQPSVRNDDFSQADAVDAAGDVAGFITGMFSSNPPLGGFLDRGGALSSVGQQDVASNGGSGFTPVSAITPDGSLLLGRLSTQTVNAFYLWSGAAPNAPGVKLDLTPPVSHFQALAGSHYGPLLMNDLASDGTVLGYKDSGGSPNVRTYYMRLPSGAETQITGIYGPDAINAKHVVAGIIPVAGTSHAAIWQNGVVTDLNTLLPANSGYILVDALAINDNGDIAGVAAHNGQRVGFLLKQGGARVIGTILRGSRVGVADRPARPVAGDVVEVAGTTSAGAAFSDSATTDATGAYAITAPAGSYTVRFPDGVCVSGPQVCTRVQAVTVNGTDVTVNGIAVSSTLSVKVTLSKSSLQLVLGKDEKPEPKTVGATVRIKNTGSKTVKAVTPQKPLYSAVGGAKVAKIPLKLLTGPTPSAGRDLKPGATIEAKYELRVSGDGKYDVEVLAVGNITGVGRVTGVGSDRLTVGAPVLVLTSEIGRKVKSADAPSLIRAGTVFTVKLKLRNISYTHTLGIYPMKPDLEGNASDGHVDIAGRPIQNPSLTAPPQPSVAIVLGPRQTREMEIVVRTTATYADVQSPELPGGGTRAVVHVPTPRVADLEEDEAVKGEIPAREIHVVGEKAYQVGIDDRDFRDPPPEANFPAKVAYFSVGVFEGVWNLTGGVAVAVFKDLPLLLAKGVIGAPSALASYAQLEAELWDSIKDDPVKVAAFLNIVSNTALLAYEHAPTLAGDTTEFVKKVDQQVLEHYTRLANDQSSGNLYAAIQEYGKEGTEITGNLVLASGILTRLPAAAEALNAIKQASYVKVGEGLNAIADGAGATEALTALKQAVPGYQFLTADLRKFYGLSENQVAYLRGFAERNRLIITLRSRAEESIKWLNEGAVLKPEQIKIKTVSIDDINYLGYREGDLGRVVVRRPLSNAELQRSLRAKGLGPQDPEWTTAFKRLKDRTTEYNHPAYDQGYVKYLEDGSTNEELTLRWNLQQNSVDSSVLPNGYTKYGMRLLDEGEGNRVLQFCVDTPPCRAGSPGWRSVTGDVDFLSITHADGSPLSALERIAVYRQMAKSPVGMLHPAADTWTLVKRGGQQSFDFPVKTNEFVRGGTAAQFGPDGVARAVVFNPASRFTGPTTYRIFWNGGYVNVKRLLFR